MICEMSTADTRKKLNVSLTDRQTDRQRDRETERERERERETRPIRL